MPRWASVRVQPNKAATRADRLIAHVGREPSRNGTALEITIVSVRAVRNGIKRKGLAPVQRPSKINRAIRAETISSNKINRQIPVIQAEEAVVPVKVPAAQGPEQDQAPEEAGPALAVDLVVIPGADSAVGAMSALMDQSDS